MADTLIYNAADGANGISDSLWGPYWISPSVGVIVFLRVTRTLCYVDTDDGGATWSSPTEIYDNSSSSCRSISCFFDQEVSSDSGTLVHIAWLDSADSDCYYTTLDVSDLTIGTKREVATGLTVDTNLTRNRVAITKTVGGDLLVAYSTQTEIGAYKSTDSGANWSGIADVYETGTEEDWVMLFPAATADDDDAAAVFWDRSADALSVKMYDDSANSWTETAIASSMTDHYMYRGMDASVRHSDGHIFLAAHSSHDNASDDLMTWDLTVDSIASPTVTAKTNIFTDTIDRGQAAVIINQQNDDVYVAHLKGNTNWGDTTDVVFHKSTDGGTNWGAEQAYSEDTPDDLRVIGYSRTVGDDGGRIQWVFFNDDLDDLFCNLTNDIEITAASTGVSGTLTATLGAVTVSGTGEVGVNGELSSTLGTTTCVSSGAVTVEGEGSATLGTLLLSSNGGSGVVGELEVTLSSLTLSGEGDAEITGTLSATLGVATLSSAGISQAGGTLNTTLGALLLSSGGTVSIDGETNTTLGVVTVSGEGTISIGGETESTLGALTLSSMGFVGDVPIVGGLSQTLVELTLVSNGDTKVEGELTQTLDSLNINSEATLYVIGETSETLGNVTVVSSGAVGHMPAIGTLSQTLENCLMVSEAIASVSGALSDTLANVTIYSDGSVDIVGELNVELGTLLLSSRIYEPGSIDDYVLVAKRVCINGQQLTIGCERVIVDRC